MSDYYGEVGSLVDGNSTGFRQPASPLQTQAFAGASALGGLNERLASAMNGTRGLLNFQPSSVGTSWSPNTIAGPNAADYAPSTMGPAPTVAAQRLADTDLTRYLNPYTT